MITALVAIGLGVLAVAAVRNQTTYGSNLEQYIVGNNPQNPGDVERLTVEYNTKASRGLL